MADLSSLTDEQLQVYKDLLISKSNPSNSIPASKPPVPAGLVGPPPGRLETAVNNLPSSLLNAVRHPSFPGMPVGSPEVKPGEDIGPTPEKIGRELSGYAHSFMHPEEDPVGSALTLASGARGILKHGTATTVASPEGLAEVAGGAAKGAYKGGTEMVPMRHYGIPLDVPAPVAGAAVGGFTGWLSHLPYGREVGSGLGAAAPVVRGGVQGAKKSLQDITHREGGNPPPGLTVPPQPEGQAPGPIGPVNRPQLPSGRTPGPVEQVPPTRYSPPQQELLDQVNGDFSSGPITKPSLPSGRQVGPAPISPPMARQGPQLPSTNRPQDIPVGPTPRPTLPSGRKVGAMGPETPQAGPVSAPGGVGGQNAPAVPSAPDVQPTQAAEFATPESKVPGPGPVGQAPPAQPTATGPVQQPNQVQDPRLSRGSIQKHLEGISRKTENVKAFVSDPANQVTVEELESLKNDLTQAEDPAKYHSAIQKAKTMGKEVYVRAKGKGAPIPDSPYKTFSLDDIDTAIKALQKP